MLSTNDVKEELSLTYVQAIASRAGYSVEGVRRDRDSVDVIIRAKGFFPDAALMSPAIDLQLKATAIDLAAHPERISFDLPVKNYKELVPRSAIPRLLVLYAMPVDDTTWLGWSEESLVLRRTAYYLNLKGHPPTASEYTTRVQIPRANVFNPETVRMLLERVAREEDL